MEQNLSAGPSDCEVVARRVSTRVEVKVHSACWRWWCPRAGLRSVWHASSCSPPVSSSADRRQPSARPRQCLHRHRGLQRAHGGHGAVLRPPLDERGVRRPLLTSIALFGLTTAAWDWSLPSLVLRSLCDVGAGRGRPESDGLLESARRVLRSAPGPGHGTRARRRWPEDRADACPLGAADQRRRLARHLRVPRRRVLAASSSRCCSGCRIRREPGQAAPEGLPVIAVRRGHPLSLYWTCSPSPSSSRQGHHGALWIPPPPRQPV